MSYSQYISPYEPNSERQMRTDRQRFMKYFESLPNHAASLHDIEGLRVKAMESANKLERTLDEIRKNADNYNNTKKHKSHINLEDVRPLLNAAFGATIEFLERLPLKNAEKAYIIYVYADSMNHDFNQACKEPIQPKIYIASAAVWRLKAYGLNKDPSNSGGRRRTRRKHTRRSKSRRSRK